MSLSTFVKPTSCHRKCSENSTIISYNKEECASDRPGTRKIKIHHHHLHRLFLLIINSY